MKKTIALCLLLLTVSEYSMPADKARGIFLSFGVGPRLPVGVFNSRSDLGYGFNAELSYTDNEFLPVFLFGRAGFEQYPGSNDFYRATEYSNYSVYSFPFSAGARYYFPPMLENIVLLMPIIELSASFNYYRNLHEFKPESGRSNYTEEITKLGVTAGAGVSMFMMEILATYSFFESSQSVGVDLKVRLPLYINF